jgi:hypothetical protein
MAYPTVDKPYGLKPVNLIGGQVFAGSTRLMEIATTANVGYGTDIFMVTWSNVLLVERLRKTQEQRPQPHPVCSWGCQFTNASTGQFQQQQFYPASTAVAAGTKIFAFVADDPDTLFQVVSCSGTTVVAGVSMAVIGSNMSLIQNAGSTITGNSAVAVLSTSTATTNSLPIRVIDVVRDTATGADAFVELIVKINIGTHQYTNSTGV